MNLKFVDPTSTPIKVSNGLATQSDAFVGTQLETAIASRTATKAALLVELGAACANAERARYSLNSQATSGHEGPIATLVQRISDLEAELLYLETALDGLGLV